MVLFVYDQGESTRPLRLIHDLTLACLIVRYIYIGFSTGDVKLTFVASDGKQLWSLTKNVLVEHSFDEP